MRLLAPIRRSTFLVLLGAALVSVALTVGVAVRAPAPMAVSAPEPVTPAGPTSPEGSSSRTDTNQPGDDAGQPGDGNQPDSGSQPRGDNQHSDGDQPGGADSADDMDSMPPATSSRREVPAGSGKFRAVAGPACPVDAARKVQISAGWQVIPGDSWTGDGCGDRFLYSSPDDANYLRWEFVLGGSAMCQVAVFVPDSPLSSDTVWYGIGDRAGNADYRIGGFTVDQKANRGQWVDGARVPVSSGSLMVNVDGNQNLKGVTAAPLRVSC